MKRPEANISLSDGELFMVKRETYAEHLANAPQRQPMSADMIEVNSQAEKSQEIEMQ
jgi:hypothetical protein